MKRVFIIGERAYNIAAPTIKKISLAGKEFKKEEISENAVSFGAIFNGMKKETLCKALSLLISGDYSLADELAQGGKEELVEPLCAIYADAGKGMKKLMQISRQICFLIAKPKIQ